MPLAIVFSLPHAAFIWSLILLAAQVIAILFFAVPLGVGIAVCAVVPLLALCIVWIVFPLQRLDLYEKISDFFSFSWPRIPSWRRYERVPDAECCDDKVLD